MKKEKVHSCTSCGVINCANLMSQFPSFCPTSKFHESNCDTISQYQGDDQDGILARASAEIEGSYYKEITRVEEIIHFAKRIGVKKIGIATCKGLLQEAKLFSQILEAKGIEYYSVICKVGANDKSVMGLKDCYKINKGEGHETMCNPILQAKILNAEKTDLNVVIGLCVGHDSLFYKYSDAIVTTLITKDRVLGHNPVAALYTMSSYYSHLLKENS